MQIFETECSGQISSNCGINFETASQFALFFIVMTHNSTVNFKLIHFLLWIKGSHQSPDFETAKFLISFSRPQVSFSSNFASLFSVMKDNSSLLFQVKRYIFCTKGTNKSGNFENFRCSGQNSPNSCHF